MTPPELIYCDTSQPLSVWPDFPETEISSGARGSAGHFWFRDPSIGLSVGLWEADANLGRWMHWPAHEFMIVVEGEVVMVEADRETVVGKGEAFYIPKGRRSIWNQAGYFRKIMLLFDGAADEAACPIAKIDPHAALSPSLPPARELLLSAAPAQHAREDFRSASGAFSVGLWQSTGYRRKLMPFPRHELMYVLEGSVMLGDAGGGSRTVRAGETVLVPMGTPNSWTSEGDVKKIFCSIEPQPQG